MNRGTLGRTRWSTSRNRVAARRAARGGALLLLAFLGGCWNGNNDSIHLGDVSLGQQLLDLQRAREGGAIDEAEYQVLRRRFIELTLQGSRSEATADGE